ncbi:hypothetical protein BU26DRAFT_511295 [Trematosphaeria pertusa]|uniref:Uncharacterized protein n=1 Tax=Trematosphaeria pertusa TaxID=390896 RepID=A0A6A6HVB2_9PLEO|nr:uncharacterized protein BU26DRAFT_511295 [Trematosphaeria pertusa]KAF2241503.1 hypothetical protein BU26DRAFT_511295 [Trematosphaeria pertusa]
MYKAAPPSSLSWSSQACRQFRACSSYVAAAREPFDAAASQCPTRNKGRTLLERKELYVDWLLIRIRTTIAVQVRIRITISTAPPGSCGSILNFILGGGGCVRLGREDGVGAQVRGEASRLSYGFPELPSFIRKLRNQHVHFVQTIRILVELITDEFTLAEMVLQGGEVLAEAGEVPEVKGVEGVEETGLRRETEEMGLLEEELQEQCEANRRLHEAESQNRRGPATPAGSPSAELHAREEKQWYAREVETRAQQRCTQGAET